MQVYAGLTKEQALSAIQSKGHTELRGIVAQVYKILMGRPAPVEHWSAADLVTWFTAHYTFNEHRQEWVLDGVSSALH